ncbi:unnamed protein product [Arctogadus glacialis]
MSLMNRGVFDVSHVTLERPSTPAAAATPDKKEESGYFIRNIATTPRRAGRQKEPAKVTPTVQLPVFHFVEFSSPSSSPIDTPNHTCASPIMWQQFGRSTPSGELTPSPLYPPSPPPPPSPSNQHHL